MTSRAGVLRSADGLTEVGEMLDKLAQTTTEVIDQDSWETTNLLTVSAVLAEAASGREETRGSHWREDFPDRDDERWSGHFDAVMADGETTLSFQYAAPSDGAAS